MHHLQESPSSNQAVAEHSRRGRGVASPGHLLGTWGTVSPLQTSDGVGQARSEKRNKAEGRRGGTGHGWSPSDEKGDERRDGRRWRQSGWERLRRRNVKKELGLGKRSLSDLGRPGRTAPRERHSSID